MHLHTRQLCCVADIILGEALGLVWKVGCCAMILDKHLAFFLIISSLDFLISLCFRPHGISSAENSYQDKVPQRSCVVTPLQILQIDIDIFEEFQPPATLEKHTIEYVDTFFALLPS